MKAFLLAAGQGTRLDPLTRSIPKCLVPIQGKPLLQIWLELCQESGIDDVLINLHAHADAVKAFLKTNECGVRVRLFEEPKLLGSAGTLGANREWIGDEELFWVLYADVLTNMNLGKMLSFHRRSTTHTTIALHQVENPTQCGIVELDRENVVRSFIEKPENPQGDLAFAGIMLATPRIFDAFPTSVPADLGFDVLPKLTGSASGYRVEEYLADIGTMPKYLQAQDEWQHC